MKIGVLSDTHGTLHPLLIPTYRSAEVEVILHAGDVGNDMVLAELAKVAPVLAVRGNVDVSGPVAELPLEVEVTLGGLRVFMTHIGQKPTLWAPRLNEPLPGLVVFGHSHIALIRWVGTTLFLNPGSAGTRPRFGGGLSAAIVQISDGKCAADIVALQA